MPEVSSGADRTQVHLLVGSIHAVQGWGAEEWAPPSCAGLAQVMLLSVSAGVAAWNQAPTPQHRCQHSHLPSARLWLHLCLCGCVPEPRRGGIAPSMPSTGEEIPLPLIALYFRDTETQKPPPPALPLIAGPTSSPTSCLQLAL